MNTAKGLHLVTEDDRLQTWLEPELGGHFLRRFRSGTDFLSHMAKAPPPALLLLDLHTGDVDGWRLCRIMRSCNSCERLPIVLVSAFIVPDELGAIAADLGADATLAMPESRAQIKGLIARLLSGAPQPREQPVAVTLLPQDGRDEMQGLLSRLGFRARTATSVADVMAAMRDELPALLLLDPGVDPDVARLVVEAAATHPSPAILLVVPPGGAADRACADLIGRGAHAVLRLPATLVSLGHTLCGLRCEQLYKDKAGMVRLTREQETEQRTLRELFDEAPAGYHTIGPDGTIISMNATELSWLGYTAAEVIGRKTVFDLQTPESSGKGRTWFEQLRRTDELTRAELEFVRKDGQRFPVVIRSTAVRDSDGRFRYARTIVEDVTRQKLMEEHMRHAQRMDLLGALSSGIAHNFNNLLTPILINASDLEAEFEKDSEQGAMLRDIEESARRAGDLVRQLTAFGRSAQGNFAPVDLSGLVEQVTRMLRSAVGSDTTVETNIHSDLVPVPGSEAHIRQAVMNLCMNAHDAMPNGGTIAIEVSIGNIGSDRADLSPIAHEGRYAIVSVSDTGAGMSRETMQRVFDPFFTTKGISRRMGLGLSVTYAIMKEHGGFVHMYSEEGLGSRFSLYFPAPPTIRLGAPAAEPPASRTENLQAYRGAEHVLLVDDEENILRSASLVLRGAGYRVTTAGDGKDALDILSEARTGAAAMPDMVLLDIVMPNVSGDKVLKQIREWGIEIPVIIASGFGATGKIRDLLKTGASAIIEKPYERKVLLSNVRHVLDSSKKPRSGE